MDAEVFAIAVLRGATLGCWLLGLLAVLTADGAMSRQLLLGLVCHAVGTAMTLAPFSLRPDGYTVVLSLVFVIGATLVNLVVVRNRLGLVDITMRRVVGRIDIPFPPVVGLVGTLLRRVVERFRGKQQPQGE